VPPVAPLHADPGSLVAVVGRGLVIVAPEQEVDVEIDAPFEVRRGLLALLTSHEGVAATEVAECAGTDAAEAAELLDRLHEAGAFVESPGAGQEAPDGTRLGDAILAAARSEPVGRWIWTADELLALPDSADPRLARLAVRAFVGGIRDEARLRAYCYVALWTEPTTWGDLPDPAGLSAAREQVAALDPLDVHVVNLDSGRVDSVPADRIHRVGAAEPHRLGTVLSEVELAVHGGLQHRIATASIPNLRYPRPEVERLGRGTAVEAREASLIARAEVAERYAAGDVARHRLIRARGVDLDGAVGIDRLVRFNDRQRGLQPEDERYDGSQEHLWIRAETGSGGPGWVLAQAVFLPFDDPERARPLAALTSSSGLAAHTDRRRAVEHALNELIERDAFMWHWVQGVSRERIDAASLPAALRSRLAALEPEGFEARLINVTLETRPVVLCALLRDGGLFAGAACHADATLAAAKALSEALLLATTIGADLDPSSVQREEVRGPLDHARLHRQADMAAENRFLVSSTETIGIGEIGALPGSAADVVRPVGELLIVDLGSVATDPFGVVRALVPGLVPISFGYDREPLGMARLAEPKRTLDGRVLGKRLDLGRAGPLVPHPFA
jgi:thiazole/oxazole-forming peptide maturase SagD family component